MNRAGMEGDMANSAVDQRRSDSGRRGESTESAGKGAKRSFSPGDAERYVATLVKFVGVVIVAIVVLALFRLILRRRSQMDPKSSLFELLEKSRQLEEEGELEPSEFQAIRSSVAENSQRLDSDLGRSAGDPKDVRR